MKKADIQWHSTGMCGPRTPAVNVKVYHFDVGAVLARYGASEFPGLTEAWIDAELTETQRDEWFNDACALAWEHLQTDAEEIFGPLAKVYSEGRSSGWATVAPGGKRQFDADDVAGWDAVALAKWARFAKWARLQADDVAFLYVSLIYSNVFLPAKERAKAQAAAACMVHP